MAELTQVIGRLTMFLDGAVTPRTDNEMFGLATDLGALLAAFEELGREIKRLKDWPDCEQCDVPMLKRGSSEDLEGTYFCVVCEAEEKQRQAEARESKLREALVKLAARVRSERAFGCWHLSLWDVQQAEAALAASPEPAPPEVKP